MPTCPFCAEPLEAWPDKCPTCGEPLSAAARGAPPLPRWGEAERPTSVLVLGLIGLLLAGIGLLMSAVALAYFYQLSATGMDLLDLVGGPESMAFQQGSCAVEIALCVLLGISCVGLLKLKPWGRKLALIYGALGILHASLSGPLDLYFNQSATADWETLVELGALTGISLLYPVALVWFMTRPKVAAAFATSTTSTTSALPEGRGPGTHRLE